MLSFCGQDKCSVDSNGRVKFSPRVISDFMDNCNGEVILHCLPEGALAVYPEDIYLEMRRAESKPAEKAGSSMVFRRNLRRGRKPSKTEPKGTVIGQSMMPLPKKRSSPKRERT